MAIDYHTWTKQEFSKTSIESNS